MVKRSTKKLKPNTKAVFTDGRPVSFTVQHVAGHPRTAKLVDPQYLQCLFDVAQAARDVIGLPSFGSKLVLQLQTRLEELNALESLQDYWRTDKEIEALRRVETITAALSQRTAPTRSR